MVRRSRIPRVAAPLAIVAVIGFHVRWRTSHPVQETRRVTITSEVACSNCTIVLDTASGVTLEVPNNIRLAMGYLPFAITDGRGFLYSKGWNPGWINVFDSLGRHLASVGQKLRRRGYTFNIQAPHIGPGDTLFLTESSRVAAYEPTRFRSVRTATVAKGLDADEVCPGPKGTFVTLFKQAYAALIRLGEIEHAYLGVFDHRGRLMRKIEVGDTGGGAPQPYVRTEVIARTEVPAGGVWVTPSLDYRPTFWSLDGRRLIEIERRADWFPPYQPPAKRPGWLVDEYQPPQVISMWLDDAGLLWTASSVRTRHRPLRPTVRLGEEGARYPWRDMPDPMIDTTSVVIEAIDVERGRLIATKTIHSDDLYPRPPIATRIEADTAGGHVKMVIIKYRLDGYQRD